MSRLVVARTSREPYSVPQIVDRHTQRGRNNVHRVEGRVSLPSFQAAEVSLIEATALAELGLRKPGFYAQLANATPKSLRKSLSHERDYVLYAPNRINPNSHNQLRS